MHVRVHVMCRSVCNNYFAFRLVNRQWWVDTGFHKGDSNTKLLHAKCAKISIHAHICYTTPTISSVFSDFTMNPCSKTERYQPLELSEQVTLVRRPKEGGGVLGCHGTPHLNKIHSYAAVGSCHMEHPPPSRICH